MAIPKMSRKQFDHICTTLKKKNIELTPENIVQYMNSKGNQKSKFYKNILSKEAEKANQLRQGWADYLNTIKYRVKIFSWHFIFHVKGYKGRLGRFDVIRAKSTPEGDSIQG